MEGDPLQDDFSERDRGTLTMTQDQDQDQDKDNRSNIEETGRTIRNSGLAYGAGISLVGAVVVMLGVGWAVDSYFDSSPIGVISGIVIGSIVGFYQFFRITAQISRN